MLTLCCADSAVLPCCDPDSPILLASVLSRIRPQVRAPPRRGEKWVARTAMWLVPGASLCLTLLPCPCAAFAARSTCECTMTTPSS